MTSIPASRKARAMIFAPRSCPSSPGLAMTTLIFRATVRSLRSLPKQGERPRGALVELSGLRLAEGRPARRRGAERDADDLCVRHRRRRDADWARERTERSANDVVRLARAAAAVKRRDPKRPERDRSRFRAREVDGPSRERAPCLRTRLG